MDMYLLSVTTIKTELNENEVLSKINQNIGPLKRFSTFNKNNSFILQRNFGGIWGLVFKLNVRMESQSTYLDISIESPMLKRVSPIMALILIFMVTVLTPVYIIISSIIPLTGFLGFLVIPPAVIYLCDKVGCRKVKPKSLKKETKYFEWLLNGEVVLESYDDIKKLKKVEI